MPGVHQQSDGARLVQKTLQKVQDRIRLADTLTTLFLMLTVFAFFLLVGVAADHQLAGGLSPIALVVFRGVLYALELFLLAFLLVRPFFYRINRLYLARKIEGTHPAFYNDFTTAIEAGNRPEIKEAVRFALNRQAVRDVSRFEPQRTVDWRRVTMSCLLAAGAGLLLGGYALGSPKAVWPSICRLLGNEAIAAPAHTRIENILPENRLIVATGQEVTFSARILYPSTEPMLWISRDGGRSFLPGDVLTMTNDYRPGATGQDYAVTWPAQADIGGLAAFEIRCGDAISPRRQLVVLPRLNLQDFQVTLHWPEYTGRADEQMPAGPLRVLAVPRDRLSEGTQISVDARANLPVKDASLVFDTAPKVFLKIRDKEMTGRFGLTEDDTYRLVFQGVYEILREESVAYPIDTFQDRPPVMEFALDSEIQLRPGDVLVLAGELRDEFGIAEVSLVFREKFQEKRIQLGKYEIPGISSGPVSYQVPVDQLGKSGQRLECYLEARDFCPPGGQLAMTRSFEVRILPPDPLEQSASDDSQGTPVTSPEKEIAEAAADRPQASSSEEALPNQDQESSPNEAADSETPGQGTPLEETLAENPQDLQKLETLRTFFGNEKNLPEPTREQNGGQPDSGESEPAESPEAQNAPQPSDAAMQETPSPAEQDGPAEKWEQDSPRSGVPSGQEAPPPSPSSLDQSGSPAEEVSQGQDGAHSSDEIVSSAEGSSFAEEPPSAEQGPELQGALPVYGRALDEARRRINDESVEPELLDALEMTPEAFKAFVEKYEERFGRAKTLPEQTRRPTQTEENAFELGGEQELQLGDRNQSQMDTARGAEAVGPETLQGLDRRAIHQVAPEYRDAVEGYFRTVGQAPAATQPEEK